MRLSVCLIFLLTSAVFDRAQASVAVQVLAKAGIWALSSAVDPGDVSPVFLSEDLVALLVRSGAPRTGTSRLVIVRFKDSKLQSVTHVDKTNEGDQLYAAAGNRVIVAARFHKYLYSSELKEPQEIPFRVLSGMFPRSNLVGEAEQGNWKAYRLSSPITVLKEGSGELLSVSDYALVFRHGDDVKIETTEGRLLGSTPVGSGTKSSHIAEIAGSNRLLVSTGKMRVTDFNGKELLSIRPPEGWGFRHGWSSDGTRMLFDHFTRTATVWDRAVEKVADSLGFGIPEESNGETIRVIDGLTGKICFSLESPGKLLGQAGGYHADLSPSGRFVAVATPSEVSIYRVPEACTE